jgi:hypothetical protein
MIEKISWINRTYNLNIFNNIPDGCGGIEIFEHNKPEDCLIRISFWDTDGQFFIDVFHPDLPLLIVEWAIFRAKQIISPTGAAEAVFMAAYPDVKLVSV